MGKQIASSADLRPRSSIALGSFLPALAQVKWIGIMVSNLRSAIRIRVSELRLLLRETDKRLHSECRRPTTLGSPIDGPKCEPRIANWKLNPIAHTQKSEDSAQIASCSSARRQVASISLAVPGSVAIAISIPVPIPIGRQIECGFPKTDERSQSHTPTAAAIKLILIDFHFWPSLNGLQIHANKQHERSSPMSPALEDRSQFPTVATLECRRICMRVALSNRSSRWPLVKWSLKPEAQSSPISHTHTLTHTHTHTRTTHTNAKQTNADPNQRAEPAQQARSRGGQGETGLVVRIAQRPISPLASQLKTN